MTTVSESELTAALRDIHERMITRLAPGEFTIKMYADANGISPHVAITSIVGGVKSGLIVFVGTRTIDGHATKIYQLKTAGEVL